MSTVIYQARCANSVFMGKYMQGESSAQKHEFIGIVLFIAAILLLLCLISYSPDDPSFNTSSSGAAVKNQIGRFGANASEFFYMIFGFTSFLLLAPLLILGWKQIAGRELHLPYLKTLGFILLISGSCAILQFSPLHFNKLDLSFNPGGVIGVLMINMLLPNLNQTGTWVVIVSALLLGILASTSFSFGKSFSHSSSDKSDSPRPGLWKRFRQWLRNKRSTKPAETRAAIPVRQSLPISGEPHTQVVRKEVPEAPRIPSPAKNEDGQQSVKSKEDDAGKYSVTNETHTPARSGKFTLPSVDLLDKGENSFPVNESELIERARMISDKCAEFDVNGSITQIHPGPVVTTFEFKPDAGVKYSRIIGLVDDLCLGIKAESLRIDRIPGKATVGIEVPNPRRETITLRELIESETFTHSASRLTLALGKLINGNPYVTDLAKMPHLLIAGATGAGKSVALNCMITSILYKATPDEVRVIFIDPKHVELGIYTDIPHLLTPIVTDPGEAANALRWATNEMEVRYKKLARRGVRNIDQYNAALLAASPGSSQEEPEKPLPWLVLIIDELADLMLVSAKEVETSISRLAAKARAVGIHLILATQRPSVDVITGIIKANFPSRIAFKVASKVDSRTILDGNGAELLLGSGDMLFVPPGTARLLRVHGAYVSEKETQSIVDHLKRQGRPAYDNSVLSYGADEADEPGGGAADDGARDKLYYDAVRIVVSEGRASTSLLQRRLSVGYGRAAKLVDTMFHNGIVGPADGSKPREVLVGLDFLERLNEIPF